MLLQFQYSIIFPLSDLLRLAPALHPLRKCLKQRIYFFLIVVFPECLVAGEPIYLVFFDLPHDPILNAGILGMGLELLEVVEIEEVVPKAVLPGDVLVEVFILPLH